MTQWAGSRVADIDSNELITTVPNSLANTFFCHSVPRNVVFVEMLAMTAGQLFGGGGTQPPKEGGHPPTQGSPTAGCAWCRLSPTGNR